MNKMFKRVMALILALAMVMSLAACGGGNDETKAPDKTEAPDNKTEAPDDKTEAPTDAPTEAPEFNLYEPYEETVTLTVARQERDGEFPCGGDMYDNVFLQFLKDYLNIEIKYEIAVPMTDYIQALNLAITGETLPDVIYIQSNATEAAAIVKELVDNDYAADITEIYEQYGGEELKARINSYDNGLGSVTFDGRLMGIQRNDSGVGEWDMVHIREDWLDKLGIKLDTDGNHLITMDELEMVAREFVAKDPGNSGDPVGLWIGNFTAKSANYSQNLISNVFGARAAYWYLDENGKVCDGYTDAGIKDAMQWYADMYKDVILDQQVGVTDLNMAKAMFVNGRLGITFGNNDNPNWVYGDTYTADPNANWIQYGLDNGTGVMANPHFSSVSHYIVVNAECEHPEAAMKVLSMVCALYANKDMRESIKADYPELYEVACRKDFLNTYNPFNAFITDSREKYEPYLNYEAWSKGELSDADFEAYNAEFYNACVKWTKGEEMTPTERRLIDRDVEGLGACYYLRENGLSIQLDHLRVLSTPTMDTNYTDMKASVVEWWVKAVTGEVPVEEAYNSFVDEYMALGGTQILEEVEELYANR